MRGVSRNFQEVGQWISRGSPGSVRGVSGECPGSVKHASSPMNSQLPRLQNKLFAQLLTCVWSVSAVNANETEVPEVHVNNIRRVFHNGEHNAFTDLIRFDDVKRYGLPLIQASIRLSMQRTTPSLKSPSSSVPSSRLEGAGR